MLWSLLATAFAASGGQELHAVEEPPRVAAVALERGVRYGGGFRGWWRAFEPEAVQEAWCLALEHHPELSGMSDREVREAVVDVPRRDGRTVRAPLERRLFELGVKARNTVLRDNHLNRRTGGRVATFATYDEDPLGTIRKEVW